ncbi:serine hydrolase [Streptomyces sp. NPDC002082]|uniref:serine hydrolase n=1 Tax=Streptomyces sp. NPDC002082 TaxID=3154772 RepID=UPI00332FE1D1
MRRLLVTAVWAIALLGSVVAGAVGLQSHIVGMAAVTSASSATPEQQAETQAPAEPEVVLDELLAAELVEVTPPGDRQLSVAVMDLETGERAVSGSGRYDTASIVKVDVLAALLLQAQDAGRALTTSERARATSMIRNSDNEATTALWAAIGGAAGLDAANQRLGLTETIAGLNGRWGLTQTTAEDQLILLNAIFGTGSVLVQADRELIEGLMESVSAGQDWGVSAADSDAALKNGWLPRTATGLWDINSIGRVHVEGREWLIAVLSDGNPTQADGIALVEEATRAAASAIRTTARPGLS